MYNLNELVRTYGYGSESEMLEDFYDDLDLSVRAIAKLLGKKYNFTLNRVQAHGIGLRPRGGMLAIRRVQDIKPRNGKRRT